MTLEGRKPTWDDPATARLYASESRRFDSALSIRTRYYHDPYYSSLFGVHLDKTILHIGAGDCQRAFLDSQWSQMCVYTDYYSALKHARTETMKVASDVQSLPFLSGSFDCVGASLVMHWVPEYKAAVSEMYDVLKPGGRCAYTIVNPYSFKRGTYVEKGEAWTFRADRQFDEKQAAGGMEVMLGDQIGPLLYYFRYPDQYVNAMREVGFSTISYHYPIPSVSHQQGEFEGGAQVHVSDGLHTSDVYALNSFGYEKLSWLNKYQAMPLYVGFVGIK